MVIGTSLRFISTKYSNFCKICHQNLAIRYGYQRFETGVMIATVVLLVALVQSAQLLGSRLARRIGRR